MKKTIYSFFLTTCFLFIGINSNAQTQLEKDTLRVLFVGNSYTYYEDMPKMVATISNNTKTKLVTEMSTLGGARLRQHWLNLRTLKTKQRIKEGKFDIVVLQGHSMVAIKKPDSLRKYSKLFSDFIRKSGAKPYFYLTWARGYAPHQQEQITKVYTEIADSNDALLVPVGEAWASVRKLRPNIELYDPDESHPSRLGAYLTAHIFVASFLNEIPKTNKLGKSKDLLFLKETANKFLSKE
tara:strand:- start:33499 stop:34215 length:717 start_codon:yes stop_codon:yes gene_type:complete